MPYLTTTLVSQQQLVQALVCLAQERGRPGEVCGHDVETPRLDQGQDRRLLDAGERGQRHDSSPITATAGPAHVVQKGGALGELLGGEDGRVHGSVHGGLRPGARLVDGIDVGLTEHHDVDVVRCRTGLTEHPGREGAAQERRLDPVDAGEPLGQDHHRAGRDHEDLTRGLHQWARVIGAQQPRTAHLPLTQDVGVQQPRDLAVRGRVGQAGLCGQVRNAQFVAGEQKRGEQARLTGRPEDRSQEGRLSSHITEIYLDDIDSRR